MRALVFAGGVSPRLSRSDLPAADLVIAADSGVHHALDIGVIPQVIVGDMDSADPDRVGDAVAAGASVISHPTDKDQTDLELALQVAVERGAGALTVVGALGGRVDHQLANIALLGSDRWADQHVDLLDASARLWVVRDRLVLDLPPGATITLLPLGGPAVVSSDGFRWDLDSQEIEPGSSLGVSNLADANSQTISVTRGVLAAIAPTE